MRPVVILTDSTAYLPKELVSSLAISSVPLAVIWGNETFEDGVTIQPEAFYSRLQSSKSMPSTSQPSVGVFQQAFARLLEKDMDVLGIFISSKISGTVQSAMQARELLPSAKEHIAIADSASTTVAMGLQVLAAARAAEQGASLEDCLAVAAKARTQSGVYFVVDTLEFLHRGGRIGGAQRLLGTALNMKPILTLRDGKIEAQERVRAKGKALERMIEIVAEECHGKSPLRLAAAHANAPEEARAMLEKASALLKPVETMVCELSPVIGTHVGPGTVALGYLTGM